MTYLTAIVLGLIQGVDSLNEDDVDEDTRLAMLGSQEEWS